MALITHMATQRPEPFSLTADERETLRNEVQKQILPRQNGCWVWMNLPEKLLTSVFGKTVRVKTMVFWMVTGRMPVGNLKATCSTIGCVNPAHSTEGSKTGKRNVTASKSVQKAARVFEGRSPEEDKIDPSVEDEEDDIPIQVHTTPAEARSRFWPSVEITPDCWLWKGPLLKTGYPMFEYNGDSDARVSMFRFDLGHYPDSKIETTCNKRLCVRPTHMLERRLVREKPKQWGQLAPHKLAEFAERRALKLLGLLTEKESEHNEVDV